MKTKKFYVSHWCLLCPRNIDFHSLCLTLITVAAKFSIAVSLSFSFCSFPLLMKFIQTSFPLSGDGNEPQSEFFIYADIFSCCVTLRRKERKINEHQFRGDKKKLEITQFVDEKWNNKLLENCFNEKRKRSGKMKEEIETFFLFFSLVSFYCCSLCFKAQNFFLSIAGSRNLLEPPSL